MALSRWMYKGQKVGSNVNFICDTATITASSQAAGGNNNVGNVVTDLVGQTWRSTGITGEWIKFDMGSAKLATMVCIFNHNLSPTATLKIYGHASNLGDTIAAWASATFSATFTYVDKTANNNNPTQNPIYTSDLHRIRGTSWDSSAHISSERGKAIWFGSQTFRWWFFSFQDASNDQAYIEVGRICMGEFMALSKNYFIEPAGSFNAEQFDSSQEVPLYNRAQMGFVRLAKYWRYNIQFHMMSYADMVDMRTLYDFVGITEPVVFAARPTSTAEVNHDNTMVIYSKVLQSFVMKAKVAHLWELDIALKEQV